MKCPYDKNASCSECEDTSQVCHPEHGKEKEQLEERIKTLEDTSLKLLDRITVVIDKTTEVFDVLSKRIRALEVREM